MRFRNLAMAAAVVAGPVVLASPAMATQNHTDPCPGQHITVYNSNSNVVLPHFVCGTAGPQGPAGPTGATGADSSVPGPKGDTGPAGPKGEPGADSTVAGPAGPAGATGPAGASLKGDKGDTGAAGAQGTQGLKGDKGDAGTNGKDASCLVGLDLQAVASGSSSEGSLAVGAALDVAGLDTPDPCRGPAGSPGAAGSDGSNGRDGKDGKSVTGPAGKDGKNGVTKTVYITRVVHEDGTVTEEAVDSLPHTGGDSDTWWIALGGVALVAAGTGAVMYYRKRS